MPASDVLSQRDVAHLLRRAGFGPTPRDLATYTGQTRADVVAALLAAKPSGVAGPATYKSDHRYLERLQAWLLRRMLSPRYRLQEKMALFWHDHFPSATAAAVRLDWLSTQNATFRLYGLGSFRELVHQVTRDLAMLEYLDGRRSRKDEVNENYGRELMELFTLGPSDEDGHPNYQQIDVGSLARALTGFTFDESKKPVVVMAADRFDDGQKVVFSGRPFQMSGVLGVENPDGTQFPPDTNVLDALFAHRDMQGRPTLARFMVRKLWAWFGTPEASSPLVDELSAAFVANGYVIGELLRALFTHDAFFSEEARSSTTKTPADFVIQTLLALDVKVRPSELPDRMERMGMELFNPPGVEGWQHGIAWLATSRYLERIDFAQAVASGRGKNGFRFQPEVPDGATPTTLVDAALAALGLEVSPETRQRLIDHLSSGDFGSEAWFETKYRGLFVLLLSLPEFQVH